MRAVDPVKLAAAHWSYIEQLIRSEYDYGNNSPVDVDEYVKRVSFHYQTAFIHGFKHGKEAIKCQRKNQ